MGSLSRHQQGFTLVEVLVGVTILSIILGTVGAAFFQSVSTQRTIVADGLAINEARKGLSWFAPDIRMAQHAEVGDDGKTLTLTWTDDFAFRFDCHTSTYAVVGDSLMRTYDGTAHTIARRVVSVSFAAQPPPPAMANTVTIDLELETGPGTTETVSMTTAMMSKPKASAPC